MYCNTPTAHYIFFSSSFSVASFLPFARMSKTGISGHEKIGKNIKVPLFCDDSFSVFVNNPDGHHSPVRWMANLNSSAELVSFFRAECFMGISRSLDQYFFRRCTGACGFLLLPWVHRVGDTFFWLQAILSSYSRKPLPACTLV